MRRIFSYAVLGLLCCSCGDDDAQPLVSAAPDASSESGSASHACAWPAPAASCTPRADLLSCLVPNGGLVEADGAILDANGKLVTDSCKNLCKSSDYALTCTGNDAASPAFSASLGCTPSSGPMPFGASAWCCPCAK